MPPVYPSVYPDERKGFFVFIFLVLITSSVFVFGLQSSFIFGLLGVLGRLRFFAPALFNGIKYKYVVANYQSACALIIWFKQGARTRALFDFKTA